MEEIKQIGKLYQKYTKKHGKTAELREEERKDAGVNGKIGRKWSQTGGWIPVWAKNT